jgi:hypothetical protein
MAFTYDPTTSIGKMRVIIPDKDERSVFFQDEELQVFLDLSGDILRASAMALETMASDQVMVLKAIQTLDLGTDGPAVARGLREHAKELRDQAKNAEASEDGGAFEIAEFADDAFTQRERIRKQWLRGL